MRAVLRRWYLSAEAYERYCAQDYDAASRALTEARAAITEALEQRRFLIGLANHCYDFHLQWARIERNRRCWVEMFHHLQVGSAMLNEETPLCVLSNGSVIRISAVDDFHRAIVPENSAERTALVELLDRSRRLAEYERLAAEVLVFTGFVIPYP